VLSILTYNTYVVEIRLIGNKRTIFAAMDTFQIVKPSLTLMPYIKHYWILRSNMKEIRRLVPIGSVELIFHRGDRMLSSINNEFEPLGFIKGQKINYYDISPDGMVDMIAIIFQPHGVRRFFQIPIDKLFENIIPIECLEIKSLCELQDKISNTMDNSLCIKCIDNFFVKQLSDTKDYNFSRLDAVISAINTHPTVNFKSLSEISCLSYKQFKRIFSEYVGLNPQEFIRIVRFQRAVSLLSKNTDINFTQLAYECGFYDQSHLIREFKIFTNYNLKEYISNNSPYSDYFT
jgi:AraC-type DNA-binding domain-containing proteins